MALSHWFMYKYWFLEFWNDTMMIVVCQGTEINLGWRETHEFGDIWHPSQAQQRTRRLPWSRIHGSSWRQGATTEQGFFWDNQRRSTWFQRGSRRAGFLWFWIQGKWLRHSVDVLWVCLKTVCFDPFVVYSSPEGQQGGCIVVQSQALHLLKWFHSVSTFPRCRKGILSITNSAPDFFTSGSDDSAVFHC